MEYQDGHEAHIGDIIRLSDGELAEVVFSIDTDEYSEEFLESEWAYLGSGIMIRSEAGVLISYPEPNEDLASLVARSGDIDYANLTAEEARLLRANLERFQARIRDAEEKARKKLLGKNDPLEPDPDDAA